MILMETQTVRLRLEFEDVHILSKPQKTEGLKRSWILLKPQHKTISDFSDYLLHIFHLNNSCPNGLILSVNGFVLPPFESTRLFKDEDVVCVKKKLVKNALEAEIVEKLPVLTHVKLLAIEEFEKETGGYESEPEEDEHEDVLLVENTAQECSVSKKRKASKKIQGSKKKKRKNAAAEECLLVSEDDVHAEKNGSDGVLPQKSLVKNDKSSDIQGELEKSSTPEIDEISNNSSESTPNAKRLCQLQENGKGSVDVSCTPGGTKKFPSRSARRKKAKRQWLREKLKIEKEELQQKQILEKHNQQSPEKINPKFTQEHQLDQDCDVEDDIVPIVIRPGHIRFAPLGKVDADQDVQKNHMPMETFQWNGITSKKKGQKWGKDKNAAFKRNDSKDFYQECSEMLDIDEETTVNDVIDFEKLKPYVGLPKVGDIVAYRLIELSSSWTPELSSFRVGKISRYDPESNKILLVPVPEYPIAFEKKMDEDASELQTDTSLYREDGSLEMDFPSLIDVRVVKHGNLSLAKSVTSGIDEVSVGNQNAVTSLPKNNNEEAHTPTKENGRVDAWQEISQALSAKKAQLSQEDDCKKESSGKNAWSYKALKSSALGPTMSLLRAQNGLKECYKV